MTFGKYLGIPELAQATLCPGKITVSVGMRVKPRIAGSI